MAQPEPVLGQTHLAAHRGGLVERERRSGCARQPYSGRIGELLLALRRFFGPARHVVNRVDVPSRRYLHHSGSKLVDAKTRFAPSVAFLSVGEPLGEPVPDVDLLMNEGSGGRRPRPTCGPSAAGPAPKRIHRLNASSGFKGTLARAIQPTRRRREEREMNKMTGLAFVLVVAAVVVGIYVVRSRSAGSGITPDLESITINGKTYRPSPADLPPEHAVSFGHKSRWLAVKVNSPTAVLKALGATNSREAGWSQGVGAPEGAVFATPPLDGWVLVVGAFPEILGEGDEKAVALVSKLSAELGTEVQYFGTHRVVDYHAWVRAKNGEVSRAYAYLGERGKTLLRMGEQSEEEKALGLSFFDDKSPEAKDDAYWRRDDLSYPDEEDVMKVAGRWSINPAELGERGAVGRGWLADWHP